jgi:hypothetical protein
VKGDRIKYRSGYKYVLVEDYATQLAFVRPARDIETEYIVLSRSGLLWVRHGYAWNGASGPTVDTRDSMRGSLVHDALYQLIREGLLEPEQRRNADRELREICVEDGMPEVRAGYWFAAVRCFGTGAASAGGGAPVLTAP